MERDTAGQDRKERESNLADKERPLYPLPAARDLTMTTNDGRPLSRGELIERLKRGESPTWTIRHGQGPPTQEKSPLRISPRQSPQPPSLLPSVELRDSPPKTPTQETVQDNYAAGLEIERPRSALHSGDFRSEKDRGSAGQSSSGTPIATSPPAPWHFAGPRSFDARPPSRSRATIHSFSHLVLMPPTSPLVQAVTRADLDHPAAQRMRSRSPEKEPRRRTFSPRSFQNFQNHCFGQSTGSPPSLPPRRDSHFPYQAHQPRRSITSLAQLQSMSTSPSPLSRSRGASQSSEFSPLHHAPMVGSYEESILRGRMSTTPSRPLNFIAQIGVLGRGKCKSSLRCPPHVTVPFPAVFYSYNSGNGRISDNQPSPYVGLVDLENSLPLTDDSDDGRRRRRYSPVPGASDAEDVNSPPNPSSEAHARLMRKRREHLKKRLQTPKAPPGGSYRIPQEGQLQIVLKNPNKTAVKLFLVPYDLSDMEPGQKTFIRQRSYSAGPIIDMPMSSRKNLGTDRPEAAISTSDDPNDRPTLRYLIHLHICCTAKGRYYLYKSIRVVFANRVPDGKDKLRNEVQLPEPKYSAYKPGRDFHGPAGSGSHSSALAAASSAEKAARRRSTPFNFAQHMNALRTPQPSMDEMDGISQGGSSGANPMPAALHWPKPSQPLPPPTRNGAPLRPIPFTLSSIAAAPPALTSASDMLAQEMELDAAQQSAPKNRPSVPAQSEMSMGGIEVPNFEAAEGLLQDRQSPNPVSGSAGQPVEGLLTRTLKGYGNGAGFTGA